MNKKILSTILSLLICMPFFSACSSKTEKKEVISTATNVSIYEVVESDLTSTVSYSGTLSPVESVSISSKVGALAISVPFDEGVYVNAGDILLELDKTDLENAYKQAEAGYNSALAAYNSVTNSSTQQSAAQAQQALTSAQTAYDQAKLNYDTEKALYENASNVILAKQNYNSAKDAYDRTKQLFDMGGASQVELDAAYTALVTAEENMKTVDATSAVAFNAAAAALTNAENNLKTAQNNISLTGTANDSAIDNATASLASAKTALDIASNTLNNATITAPISGYISKCNVSVGQLVSPGIEIFCISNTAIVDAEINVTESVIPYMTIGGEASVNISAAKLSGINGTITGVNPVKDQMTGLYNVKISIDNSTGVINAGMMCDVELVISELNNIIKVPSEALINSGNEYFVYIAKGDKAEKVRVVTGISDNEYTEIITGVNSGDKVIVSGKEYLSEKNNEIRITEEYK